jgi:hypothetical protein
VISNDLKDKGGCNQVSVRQTLKRHAEDSFELAYEFVRVRKELVECAGTFRSLFHKIDFNDLFLMAKTMETDITEKAKEIAELKNIIQSENDSEVTRFYLELVDYIEALENAARFLSETMFILTERAKNRRRLGLRLFIKEVNSNQATLKACQRTGDTLTETFHKMKW